MRNTMQGDGLKDKIDAADKETIEKKVQETLDWLDRNQLAETDEFEGKQKELEGVCNPIMMKVYSAGGAGAGMPGGFPGMCICICMQYMQIGVYMCANRCIIF